MKSLKISPVSKPVKQTASPTDRPSIWQRDIQLGNAFPAKARQQFYHTLGLLLESGLGLLDCMEVMVDQFPQKALTNMLKGLQEDLVAGASLSQALTKQKRFSSPGLPFWGGGAKERPSTRILLLRIKVWLEEFFLKVSGF